MPPVSASPAYRDLSDWVVLRVLEAIRAGDIRPGERLVEHDVAARFMVSRAPVRDALHKLESLGVAERRFPRGIYVRAWTDQDATELLQVLDALILMSVQLAADRLTSNDLEALTGILRETERVLAQAEPDPARRLALDLEFHRVIAEASGNRRLADLMTGLSLPLSLYTHETYAVDGSFSSASIHADLLEALRRRDVAASVASVLRNAPKSRAMFERALRQRALGESAGDRPNGDPAPHSTSDSNENPTGSVNASVPARVGVNR